MEKRKIREIIADFERKYIEDLSINTYWNNHKKRFTYLLYEIYKLHPSKKILEVGTRPYYMTYFLSKHFKNYFGVDFFLVNTHFDFLDTQKHYKVDINKSKLPFDNSFFDVVIFSEVLEHLENPMFALQEIYRVLKQDGILIVSTPNLYYFVNYLLFLLGRSFKDDVVNAYSRVVYGGYRGHVREFSRREVLKMLNLCKFNVLKFKYVQFFPVSKSFILVVIYSLLCLIGLIFPFFRGFMYFVINKKRHK